MSQEICNQNDFNLTESGSEEVIQSVLLETEKTSPIDPQVKVGSAPKRKFSAQYKLQILTAYDACNNALERGALLRREGLYSSTVPAWRQQLGADNEGKKRKAKTQRIDHLVNEVEQLKKKLDQAQAIIDLQKKVSELLGTYILPHETKVVK